ncbi:MAG: MFS transporter [Leptospirales bacterium]|nr:MFS transporter [Leptospirales bacterium]
MQGIAEPRTQSLLSRLPGSAGLLFLAMLPTTMLVPLQTEIMGKLSGTPREMALFTSIAMLGMVLLSPLAGYLSDRFRARRAFVVAFSLANACTFPLISLAPTLPILLVARFLEGGTAAFVIGTLMACAEDRERAEPQGRRGLAMGISGMMLGLGAALGMPIGGIIGRGNWHFAAYAASALMMGVAILAISLRDQVTQRERSNFTSILTLLQHPIALIPICFAFVDRFVAGFLVGPFTWRLRDEFGLDPAQAGRMLAYVMLPMVLGAIPAAVAARKLGAVRLVLVGSIIYAVFIGVSGTLQSAESVRLTLLIAGLGAGFLYSPSMVLAGRLAPDGLTATAMSLYVGIGSLGFLLGPLVGVEIRTFLDRSLQENQFAALSWTMGSAALIPTILLAVYWRRLRALE